MRALKLPHTVLLLSLFAAGQAEAFDAYFGQTAPVDTPVVFAPGIISKNERFEQFILFAPDGRSLDFCVTNADWSAFSLYEMTLEDGRWTEPVPAPFLGSDSTGLTSCLSYNMQAAFFTSPRPAWPPSNIWMSRRGEDSWLEPTKMESPISSTSDEWEVAIARNGTLYFSSNRPGGEGDMDVYRAPLVDGAYPTAENLGPPINTKAGDDLPFIAPDESYLVFASNRENGLGQRDLYISFQVEGAWIDPVNLGAPINTEYWDIYPSISPDGKYLFFTRRQAWLSMEDSDIYWVSAGFIERLKKSAATR